MTGLGSRLERFHEPRQTAQEAVLAALREAIVTGALEGGTRLVQSELATHFGVSNTPVREALRQLAAEGLVHFDSYRGAEVRTPSPQEVVEVYEILFLLEPLIAARAAARMTAKQAAHLTALHQEMSTTAEVSEWVSLNRSFHAAIHEAAGSALLASIIGGLIDASTVQVAALLSSRLIDVERSNAEHDSLVEALAGGDGARSADAMSDHIGATLEAVQAAIVERGST